MAQPVPEPDRPGRPGGSVQAYSYDPEAPPACGPVTTYQYVAAAESVEGSPVTTYRYEAPAEQPGADSPPGGAPQAPPDTPPEG